MPGDSAADAVKERSGRSYRFRGMCCNEGCPEYGQVKIFFAVRGGNNLIHLPDVWCGECVTQLGGVGPVD